MKLGAYLQQQGISQAAFGGRIGRTQGRVSQLVRGHWPSKLEAERIVAVTDGAVTANDWVGAEEAPAA